MKRRILSALTSLALVTLVALALIFVPFEANSDIDQQDIINTPAVDLSAAGDLTLA
ncbi:MAG: hypothetical protein J5J00_07790 [Deltaproteobacteria bacterium]|nr:hypothetical protein [Deltaproteobacteria bacterium]